MAKYNYSTMRSNVKAKVIEVMNPFSITNENGQTFFALVYKCEFLSKKSSTKICTKFADFCKEGTSPLRIGTEVSPLDLQAVSNESGETVGICLTRPTMICEGMDLAALLEEESE